MYKGRYLLNLLSKNITQMNMVGNHNVLPSVQSHGDSQGAKLFNCGGNILTL